MDSEDPYIGQIIYSTGGKGNGDTWDDSELIDYWNKAKEAYKKRLDQQTRKAAPFSTTRRYGQKQRVEKRTPLKKKATPRPLQTLSSPSPQQQDSNNNDDGLTQMIMAWYYAGYYTALYTGGFRSGA